MSFDIQDESTFILMLRPRSGVQQWVSQERYEVHPRVQVTEYTDGFGNLCQRLWIQGGRLEVRTSAQVDVADKIERNPGAIMVDTHMLPDYVVCYLLPSRYCESDRLNSLAMSIVADATPGYAQVAALVAWVRSRLVYVPGSVSEPLSALELLEKPVGICRDMAHLAMALCRSINLPARMCVGYLYGLEPMDMHAWFEVFLEGRWQIFDPTQTMDQHGYVVLAYGRDAADVAMYNQFGLPAIIERQLVSVKKLRGR
jgi:transglutaminase-like putative cysteine protease